MRQDGSYLEHVRSEYIKARKEYDAWIHVGGRNERKYNLLAQEYNTLDAIDRAVPMPPTGS